MERTLRVSIIIFCVVASISVVTYVAQWAFYVTISVNNLHERVKQLEARYLQK